MEEAKRAFPISEDLLNAILGYLSIRPFNEVNNLIAAIQSEVQPVLEPAKDQAAKEVKEEPHLVAVPPKDKDKEEPKDQEPKKEE